jgi:putative aminopeptidase FrvX
MPKVPASMSPPAVTCYTAAVMMPAHLKELLQKLVAARGPCGQEDEVDAVCRSWLDEHGLAWRTDPAGNLIARLAPTGDNGPATDDDGRAIRVFIHLDEISFIIKRIRADGTVKLAALGSFSPAFLGQLPVEILADDSIVPGVLSLGSWHTGEETSDVWHAKHGNYDLNQYEVITGMDGETLVDSGVRPGARVVIAGQHRFLWDMGSLVAGFALDNRAPITATLEACRILAESGGPAVPVYVVFTREEELGSGTAGYAAGTLPGELSLAVDVAPVSPDEYGNEVDPYPTIGYRDDYAVYTKDVADALVAHALDLEMLPGIGIFENYSSDSSAAKRLGRTAKAALVGIPMENTHGYEIIHAGAIENTAHLLAAFLRDPQHSGTAGA